MVNDIDRLSKLLRELEADIGTSETCNTVLRTLQTAIDRLDVSHAKAFYKELCKLTKILSETKPRFGILNYYFKRLKTDGHKFQESSDWREKMKMALEELHENARSQRERLLKNAASINVKGKTILIHDHSHTVHEILLAFKRARKKFNVIIAEQDVEKTHQNIEVLHQAGIPFQVIPSYMLSHIQDNVDMVFFGGLTLKDSMDFVMDPGTYGVISQFRTMKIPVYMFINTAKFSLWKSKPRGEIFFHAHKRSHHSKPIEYDRIKYSHDRVPTKLFHKIVTNKGTFSPLELKKTFEKLYSSGC